MQAMLRYGFLFSIIVAGACASGDAVERKEPRYRIIPNPEPDVDTTGIPTDKQADILTVMQHREPTARKCYNDELNRLGKREFQGEVTMIIEFGTQGRAIDVVIDRDTLESEEVTECLMEAVKGYEFPKLDFAGKMNYTYHFQPAY